MPNTSLQTVEVTAPKDTGVTVPATPPVETTPTLQTVEVTAPKDTGINNPATPPVVTTPTLPTVTVIAPKDPGITVPATPPVVPVLPPVTITTPPAVVPPTPPVVVPPTPPVTPKVVTPKITNPIVPITNNPVKGNGLNPGYIQPTAFYKTNNPVQSQFYWGSHGYQYGPTFNQAEYNSVMAPNTPYGLQQGFSPLTANQISALVQGHEPVMAPVANPATRINPYTPDTRIPPSYGQLNLQPQYKNTVLTNNTVGAIAPTTAPTGTYDQVNQQLGNDWSYRLQAAANSGDWATYYAIQKQVNDILYPQVTTTVATA